MGMSKNNQYFLIILTVSNIYTLESKKRNKNKIALEIITEIFTRGKFLLQDQMNHCMIYTTVV